jgi:uncharacterized protein (DUF924 family)
VTPQEVIRFWAEEVGEGRWFDRDAALDAEIARRFGETCALAREGKLATWENSADGALALLILLDQFPRNMFRGKAPAFASDFQAHAIAERAIARGLDLQVPAQLRCFFYLPFTHSECMGDQEQGLALIGERLGKDNKQYAYALMHRELIAKFGRFPSRNVALKRQSTTEELEYLKNNPLF